MNFEDFPPIGARILYVNCLHPCECVVLAQIMERDKEGEHRLLRVKFSGEPQIVRVQDVQLIDSKAGGVADEF